MEQNDNSLKEGQFFSIALPVDFEITIKHSLFIASLRIASNKEEFNEILKQLAIQYPKANHYCWAYRFNTKPITEHASDAGEPPGTAGRPILGSLKKYSLLNTMAVVTRYYGGIKLGVKGLISAYGGTTFSAIENAEIIIREPMLKISFTCRYELYNTLLSLLQKYKIDPSNIQAIFAEDISGEILLPKSTANVFLNDINYISPQGKIFSYTIITP
ncbi:MAG: IMPACT family protein [Synergistaceae bacterium]|jgi:uncharacterized YigZ family protein|nr:IMPACT family protein [Synergistaceae bacterium]